MTKLVTLHKIGDNRGRKRIWLDGKRLTASGFNPGTTYYLLAAKGELRLTTTAPRTKAEEWQTRKVSGRDSKPIIDIVGATVSHAFGAAKQVRVEWTERNIRMERT